MSESLRERARRRIKEHNDKLKLTPDEIEHFSKYIEQYCLEGDKRCKRISPEKAVDQVIDEMSDDEFDKFLRALIKDVKARMDKQKKKKKLKKKKKVENDGYTSYENVEETDTEQKEQKKEITA